MKHRMILAAVFATVVVAPVTFAAEPEKLVVIEARIFKLHDESAQALKIGDLAEKKMPRVLSLKERAAFLADLKDRTDLEMTTAPMMVTRSNQTTTASMQQECQFLTGMMIEAGSNGSAKLVPKTETQQLGVKVNVTPRILPDGKILVRCEISETTRSPESMKLPVTTLVNPIFEGGSMGAPVPFTTFIEAKAFDTASLQQTVMLPDGQSLLASLGRKKCESTVESKLPILGDLDIVGDLFHWRTTTPEVEHTFVLLTATTTVEVSQVATPPMASAPVPVPTSSHRPAPMPMAPVAAQPMPMPQAMPPVPMAPPLAPVQYQRALQAVSPEPFAAGRVKNAEILNILLREYDAASRAGDTAKAKTIAAYCLEMDPTCFAKR